MANENFSNYMYIIVKLNFVQINLCLQRQNLSRYEN